MPVLKPSKKLQNYVNSKTISISNFPLNIPKAFDVNLFSLITLFFHSIFFLCFVKKEKLITSFACCFSSVSHGVNAILTNESKWKSNKRRFFDTRSYFSHSNYVRWHNAKDTQFITSTLKMQFCSTLSAINSSQFDSKRFSWLIEIYDMYECLDSVSDEANTKKRVSICVASNLSPCQGLLIIVRFVELPTWAFASITIANFPHATVFGWKVIYQSLPFLAFDLNATVFKASRKG